MSYLDLAHLKVIERQSPTLMVMKPTDPFLRRPVAIFTLKPAHKQVPLEPVFFLAVPPHSTLAYSSDH